MSVYTVLESVREEHGGLNRRLLVDIAADKAHPLHSHFEWDNKIAGDEYRLIQAGQLLRITYQPLPDKPTRIRRYHVTRDEETETTDYRPTEEILSNPFSAEILLRQMRRDWKTFERRYRDLASFAAFVQAQIGESA